LRGDQTLSQIAARYKLHSNQISQWKRQALDGLSGVFAGGKSGAPTSDMDAKIKELHAKIGELTVEKDFLSRGLDR
jgi:transposase-like protein